MKKKVKKQSKRFVEHSVPAKPLKVEKSSVIVLAIAAVIFLIAFFSIYSKDILLGSGDIFSPYGDELIEFEKATVNEIPSEELMPDEVANGAYTGTQELAGRVKSGRY